MVQTFFLFLRYLSKDPATNKVVFFSITSIKSTCIVKKEEEEKGNTEIYYNVQQTAARKEEGNVLIRENFFTFKRNLIKWGVSVVTIGSHNDISLSVICQNTMSKKLNRRNINNEHYLIFKLNSIVICLFVFPAP